MVLPLGAPSAFLGVFLVFVLAAVGSMGILKATFFLRMKWLSRNLLFSTKRKHTHHVFQLTSSARSPPPLLPDSSHIQFIPSLYSTSRPHFSRAALS